MLCLSVSIHCTIPGILSVISILQKGNNGNVCLNSVRFAISHISRKGRFLDHFTVSVESLPVNCRTSPEHLQSLQMGIELKKKNRLDRCALFASCYLLFQLTFFNFKPTL